jgi:hypothetical protein
MLEQLGHANVWSYPYALFLRAADVAKKAQGKGG